MKRIYFSFLLLQIFSVKSFSQTPVVFKGDNLIIGNHVSILEDPHNHLPFQDARIATGYVPSKSEVPNLNLSKSYFWLKFSVKNMSPENHLLLSIDYPTLDLCEFYSFYGNKYMVQQFNDTVPFNNRKYKHQNFIFDIYLPQNTTGTFYLRVGSSEQMVLPLILGTPQKIAESMLTHDLVWGVLIGLIMVMILYNLFIFISTKDRSYLYYVLYTTFIGFTQTSLSGYTYHFIFYDNPVLFNKGLIIFPALAGISAVFFVSLFLHTRERTPKLHKVLPLIIILYVAAIILRIFGFDHISYRMIDISALACTLVIFSAAIIISLQGFRPARLFLLAWTIFLIGIVLFVLRNLGVLPYNNFTNYTMQVGTALEITLLSLALADKINIFKAEKERSQQETVNALMENERIIKEQNVILELKVNERTVELSESNQELNSALENLKAAQTQLVESEKMASLGQLTAGIAHEINNPINFVTSNISPLKRDIEMVLEALNVIENVGVSDSSAADKLKQIKEYKEELDFDYLTTEITHLIKGINDGASRTAEIVRGLRFFSRLDEDNLKEADINEGLESTMAIANNLLNNKIKIIKEFADLPRVECYPGKLNQVFLNIITNAVYAIQKRFGKNAGGEIIINTSFDEKNISIKIKDNGTGMDAQTQKKVFEPFFTTKDVGEGTGLGMSIAYNIVKKHNGTINVNSVQGEGTEFILQIPTNFTE
ncbi:sensor histidine kinase [Mucilaginibacter ginsenosidivorans]|uniref:histidine kinase n=1 Tax=Mucilaginibacter ginsenosidivorans TaxID=398053 RepID=A0A5B8UZ12_9SPHI|nr:7TM diverse intracellular signaling domain-containing protein [Mucilaginibacter ginsenosidivorans]QEC64334.1 histidine kinase [Mucilaginibacter ginsenosidivorans]